MSYYEFHVSRRYVQFDGALRELPRYASTVGRRLLILVASIPERVEGTIAQAMAAPCREVMRDDIARESPRYAGYRANAERYDALREGMEYEFYEIVDRIPSEANIRAVADYARDGGFDTVVGVGGGRGLDFARGITHFLPVKVILVPTLAATNAPISTLSVIYSDDGSEIRDYWRMDRAPDLTLVDTGIIAGNPPQALASGIADIVCTYFEGLCNLDLSGARGQYPELSYRGLELAIQIMKESAPKALDALRAGQITPEFESVVSMIMHNCGPLWTACSMGLAHALDEVFLHFAQAHRLSHGMRVGFATLPMLSFAGKSDAEIDDCAALLRRIGVPTALREMGMDGIPEAEWRRAAAATIGARGTLEALPFEVTFDAVLPHLLRYA